MQAAKIILSLLVVALGWFFLGYGYSTLLGHPISTVLFIGGLALSLAGVVGVILSARSKA
ncbi:hypothetical protein PKOR_11445 [Pontibacter korlensis]|uniref:Uncharacterized protein n=1 Tax=Pontibacter korlensis TaxID=400092 RepID=A0A0E3UWS3_9BACT|nr:hypothetical protein [Pontibacter korlensis]AKD03627.1 hypothetical protein PKOR_11445 [Pontibacter korlensis]